MSCSLKLPFNRWQCDPHFTLKVSMSSNTDGLKITTCNFSDLNCWVYLLILCLYPEKDDENAILYNLSRQTHQRAVYCNH